MRNIFAKMIVAVVLAMPVAAQAAEQTPEQFVRAIYNAYAGDPEKAQGISIEDEASVKRWFAPDLAAMIIKDTKDAQAREDVPALDFDPFINGQDFALTGGVVVKATAQAADRATVTATFTNSGRKEMLTYTLVKAGGQWKVSDIAWGTEGTLRDVFKPHPDGGGDDQGDEGDEDQGDDEGNQ